MLKRGMAAEQYPKNEYQGKMRAYLNTLSTQLDEIVYRLERRDVQIRIDDPAKTIDRVRDINDIAHDHLHSVETTDGVMWEEFRFGMEAACDALTAAMNFLAQRVVVHHGGYESNEKYMALRYLAMTECRFVGFQASPGIVIY